MSENEKKAIEIIKQEIDKNKVTDTPKEVYITDIKMLLNIVKKQEEELDKERNAFNIEHMKNYSLLKQIEKQREEIEIWKETENDYEHELARKDEEIIKKLKGEE